jgi:hypothetical protein
MNYRVDDSLLSNHPDTSPSKLVKFEEDSTTNRARDHWVHFDNQFVNHQILFTNNKEKNVFFRSKKILEKTRN